MHNCLYNIAICLFITNLIILILFVWYLQEISQLQDNLSNFRNMNEMTTAPQIEQNISQLEKKIEGLTQEQYCYEAQIFRVCLYNLVSFISKDDLLMIRMFI